MEHQAARPPQSTGSGETTFGLEIVLWETRKNHGMDWLINHLTSLAPSAVYDTLASILLLCGLGLPIPEDVSLISAGYLAHMGVVNVHKVFLVCFAAVLGGDCLAFTMGRLFGSRLLDSRLAQRFFRPRKQIRVRAYFRKFGSKVIFIARFLPGLRFSIFLSAGTLRVRPSTFFIYDALAALVSVPALVYLAWIFGEHIDHVVSWARRSEYGILIVAVLAAVWISVKILRKRRREAAAALTEGR
jgi:membrane protein DedA with SNARE-associated domain